MQNGILFSTDRTEERGVIGGQTGKMGGERGGVKESMVIV